MVGKIFEIYKHNKHCRFALGNSSENPLLCIGINPSTATDEKTDPTICKILKIAKNNGYDGVIMLNISPEVSTKPNGIRQTLQEDWHKENLEHIKKIFDKHKESDILACWGNNIDIRAYLTKALRDICVLAGERNWFMLEKGFTKNGHPRHPLYLSQKSELKKFEIGSYF